MARERLIADIKWEEDQVTPTGEVKRKNSDPID
jgi:hypothetical protein